MGRSLGWVWLLLLLVVSCGGGDQRERVAQIAQNIDVAAPTWPSGASLSVTLRTPTRIGLEWPAAEDDVGVAGYHVFRGANVVATLAAWEHSWVSTGHSPSQTFLFEVRAFDAADNVSAPSALVSGTTTQGPSSAPVWGSSPALTVPMIGKRQVNLRWDGATDDYGELRFEIRATASGVTTLLATIDGASGYPAEWTSDRQLSPGNAYSFEVRAVDYEGNVAGTSLAASGSTHAATDLPVWGTGSAITAQRQGWSSLSVIGPTAAMPLDVDHFAFARRPTGGSWQPWTQAAYPFAFGNDFNPGQTWELRLQIVDDDGLLSVPLETSLVMPAPTLGTPPPLDQTQASDLMDIASFLYTGADPVQEGVDVGALVRERVAVLHGQVVRR